MPSGVPKKGYRIRSNGQRVYVGAAQPVEPPAVVVEESEAAAHARIKERFEAMEILADTTFFGDNKALIISGPAGVGKSTGIMKVAKDAVQMGRTVVQIKGNVGATGLYRSLYENRFATCTTVFDDADAIFGDDTSLNLLKAACDSTAERQISWLKEIKMEDDEGTRLPRQFVFEGSIIFITNLDFDELIARNNRLTPHLIAMMSRAMYLDTTLKTPRDYLIRIKQVLFELGMMKEQRLSETQAAQVLTFLEENVNLLRELSLRMVVKLTTLIKNDPCNWQKFARITCFKT